VYLIVLLFAASALYAGDPALDMRARADFDRVESASTPLLSDAMACVQSQAAVLPVTMPGELPRIHYRKAYCTLLEGVLKQDAGEERQAAREFDKAIEAWPERTQGPAPPGLRVLSAIAELIAGPEPADLSRLDSRLGASADVSACGSGVMSLSACKTIFETGLLWKGWIAERQNRLAEAARIFQEFPDTGWPSWVGGRQAMQGHRYSEAVPLFEKAVNAWNVPGEYRHSIAPAPLLPTPDVTEALAQLGQAQFLSGQYAAAIASFEACLRRQPRNDWAIFLRGRARDALGQKKAALEGYDLASRMALAGADASIASGDAHFYRGVWFFRRGEIGRAEEEFATALSAGPSPPLKADVLAWWRMAAVAGGACQSSTVLLENSLASVSDFFPKNEARDLIGTCRRNARNASSHGAAVCYSAG